MANIVNPHEVARNFVKQYYGVLSEMPEKLHHFYTSDAQFSHSENLSAIATISSPERIKEEVANLKLKGAHVDLEDGFVHAQTSDNEGVLVIVTGHYTPPEKSTSPRFMHTFFLAMNKGTRKYHVSNSVFNLLPEEAKEEKKTNFVRENVTMPKEVVEEPLEIESTDLKEAVFDEVINTETVTDEVNEALATATEEELAISDSQSLVETAIVDEQNNNVANSDADINATVKNSKNTYLDIVKRISAATNATDAPASTTVKVSNPTGKQQKSARGANGDASGDYTTVTKRGEKSGDRRDRRKFGNNRGKGDKADKSGDKGDKGEKGDKGGDKGKQKSFGNASGSRKAK